MRLSIGKRSIPLFKMGDIEPFAAPLIDASITEWAGWWVPEAAPGDGCAVVRVDHAFFGDGWVVLAEPSEVMTGRADTVIQRLEGVDGWIAFGYVPYDASADFESALPRPNRPAEACFAVYRPPLPFYKFLPAPPAAFPDFRGEIDRETYAKLFHQVKAHLAAGNSYQANLTFRMRTRSGSLWLPFCASCADDPPPFASFFVHGGLEIASFSPELFFARSRTAIRCRPMKGTARRGGTRADDEALGERLRSSEKERAENLMIVDMIRNDLGRIAKPGTVHVPKLFEVERHPGVLQMTSTVEAVSDGSLGEVFEALFPCASIVGAPKIETQRILAELEPSPRGVYTGAIGFVKPGGDCQFSVAIRTAVREVATGGVEYGVGGGIVWDSELDREWEECLLKASPLTRQSEPPKLLETIRWDGEWVLLEGHLDRMARSAHELGFPFSVEGALGCLDVAVAGKALPQRVRLLLGLDGRFEATYSDAPPHASFEPSVASAPLEIAFAGEAIRSGDPALRHKTNRRRIYDRLREAGPDCDDLVLFNERGEATEFLIGNLVARFGNTYVTPPFESGLLPGVFRQDLLDRGVIVEGTISLSRLREADEIVRVNSVSGWRPCAWIRPMP